MAATANDSRNVSKDELKALANSVVSSSNAKKRLRQTVCDYITHGSCDGEMINGEYVDNDAWTVWTDPDFSSQGLLRFDGRDATLTIEPDLSQAADNGNDFVDLPSVAWSPCDQVRVRKHCGRDTIDVFERKYGHYEIGGLDTCGHNVFWAAFSVRVYDGRVYVLGNGSTRHPDVDQSFWILGSFPQRLFPTGKGTTTMIEWFYVSTMFLSGRVPRSVFDCRDGQPAVVFRSGPNELSVYNCIVGSQSRTTFSNLDDFDSDGRGVVVCADGHLVVWDSIGRRVLQVIKLNAILPPDQWHGYAVGVRIHPTSGRMAVFLLDGGALYLNRSYAVESTYVPDDLKAAEAILAASASTTKLGLPNANILRVAASKGSAWVRLLNKHFVLSKSMLRDTLNHCVLGFDTAVVRLLLSIAEGLFSFSPRTFWCRTPGAAHPAMSAMLEVILPRANMQFKEESIDLLMDGLSCYRSGEKRSIRDILDALLTQGCTPPRNIFSTIFVVMEAYGKLEEQILCKILRHHSARINLNAMDIRGRTALHQLKFIGCDAAAESVYRHLLRLLLKSKADPNAGVVGENVPPLLTAINRNDTVATALLLQANADPFKLSIDLKSSAASEMLFRESMISPPPYESYAGTFITMLQNFSANPLNLVHLLYKAIQLQNPVPAIRIILAKRGKGTDGALLLQYLLGNPEVPTSGVLGMQITDVAFKKRQEKNTATIFNVIEPTINQIAKFYIKDAQFGWHRITRPRLHADQAHRLALLIQKHALDGGNKTSLQTLRSLANYFDIELAVDDAGGVGWRRRGYDWYARQMAGAKMFVAWPQLSPTKFTTFEPALQQVVRTVLLCRQRLSDKWVLDVCLYMLTQFFSTDPADFVSCWAR